MVDIGADGNGSLGHTLSDCFCGQPFLARDFLHFFRNDTGKG